MEYDLIAPCYFGTESAAAFDFKRIGAKDVAVTDGRVSFRGDADIVAAANLWSRCAERVLILLGTFEAKTFDALFDGVAALPWEELLPADAEFPVKGSSLSSTLSSVPACQSIVKKAVVERLRRGHHVTQLPETGALYKIRFSIRKDKAEIMLDTSGEGLHKRGYRRNSTEAPIKETLAAANAKLAGVDAHCRFAVTDVADFAPDAGSILFTNPPYGERLGDLAGAARLAKTLGERLAANPVRGAYIITADADFEQHFGRRAARRRKLYNGMIPCQVYMYF